MQLLFPIVALVVQYTTVPSDDEIVVTAGERTVQQSVAALSSTVTSDRPLARFYDPVCVQSVGLPPAANHVIEEQVRSVAQSVAQSVALRTKEAGCTPNVTVMFVPDARAAFARLSRSRPLLGQTLADVRRIRAQADGARVWIDREIRSRDGDRPSYSPDAPSILTTSISSRLSLPIRNDIVGATLLIDRDRVAGVALQTIAAYVAYRALAGIALLPMTRRCSVLSIFDPGMREPVKGLGKFDHAYLNTLYSIRGDLSSTLQRAMIANRIAGEIIPVDPNVCPQGR